MNLRYLSHFLRRGYRGGAGATSQDQGKVLCQKVCQKRTAASLTRGDNRKVRWRNSRNLTQLKDFAGTCEYLESKLCIVYGR